VAEGGCVRIITPMARMVTAFLMNLGVPGSGLMLLGRAWLGFAVAVWFCIATEVAICGKLIAPATMPWRMTAASAALGLAAWLLGQGLLISRIRYLRGRLPAGLFSGGDPDAAHGGRG
jgi:hypothetical protein